MWDKFRSLKSRRSSHATGESGRSSSPVAVECEPKRISNVADIFHKGTEKFTNRTEISSNNGNSRAASSRIRERSQNRKADPLGLSVLYVPELPPSIDIIFIHGLGGTSRQTWSKDRDPELFWPQKWLPLEPGICTSRIFSFGYDANFFSTGSNSIANLSDFAKSLLFSMKFGKDESGGDLGMGSRPILFVTHSMGGLVFKKAYIQGQCNGEYRSIIDQIRGVLFLSTPHRGTHLAEILNRILTISIFNHAPKKYITELNRNSSSIEDINELFRNFSPKLGIFSFYETLETMVGPKSMMVLTKDSSILGYPGEVSLPLNADHHNVCKYSSVHDPNYISVRSVLQTLVSIHSKAHANALNINLLATKQRITTLLGVSVAPIDDLMSLRYFWTPGTCESILSDPDYQKWKSNIETSNILWINSQPGSGKSVLAAFFIGRFLESGMKCHYYFFKHDDSTKRSASSLLRSLAFQIAQDVPKFEAALDNMTENGVKLEKLDARQIWHKLFVSILFGLESVSPLYWVFDALDESESMSTIMELLASLGYSKMPIHIILLSRPTPSITRALDRVSNILPVAVKSPVQNFDDIKIHVTREIEYMHGAAEFRQAIVRQIIDRSEGNFLWVSLVLREIMECHCYEEVISVMEEIPSGMDSLYQRMEAKIKELPKPSDKSLARQILIWVTYSRRPLAVDELLQALQPKISAVLDIKFTVNKICGHFVTIDSNDCVSLVHRTAHEYLIKTSNLPFSVSPHESHRELFIRTLSVYLDPQLRSRLHGDYLPAFYSYSATSWAYHLNLSPADSEDILDMLIKFFGGPYILSWVHSLALLGQLKVLIFTSQGLTSFICRRRKLYTARKVLLQRVSDLQPLELWAIDLLKIVGKFGGHLLQEPSTIYTCIAQFCPHNSALFRQFSESRINPLSVSGLSNMEWDDCLAKISVENDGQALLVKSSDSYIAVSSSNGEIHIWNSLTFEKTLTLLHQEHIFFVCFSENGDKLASYGQFTTRIWEIPTGRQLCKVSNFADSRTLCMNFINNDTTLITGSELRNISMLFLSEAQKGWQLADISTASEATALKGTFQNTPIAMTFNSNATRVAIAYRGSPMTVWSLDKPKCINKCRRRLGRGKHPDFSWTGVNRVCWHPGGEVLGIYTDGVVFKWHPFEGSHNELETSFESTPSEIQCSREGAVFATSDVNGTIRLFNYEHFALIYQLSSEDVVTAICFSPDTRRFYDLRGSYCNAWEPNVLIRISNPNDESANIDNDTDTEAGSTVTSFLASEAWTESHAPITALSIRLDGSIVCVGNDEGIVELHDVDKNTKLIVGKSALEMGIEHLTWAKDGKTFAYAELGGKVVINSLSISDDESQEFGWNCEIVASFKSSLKAGAIAQFILSPDSKFLLTTSSSSVELRCIDTKSIYAVHSLSQAQVRQQWITHPTNDDQLLAFSIDTITAYGWSDLQQLNKWQINLTPESDFSNKTVIDMPGIPRKNSSGDAITHSETNYQIEQIVATNASDYILIHISQQSPNLVRKSHIQIIKVSSLSDAYHETPHPLPTIYIPPEISQDFEKPLGIVGKDLLVFLDKSFWVCTFQIQVDVENEQMKPKRHFFLPRDWINAESLNLCQAMDDGTIVCPRKGEVAVIRSDLASGW